MQGRVVIETYGCTLNKADSRIMAAILKEQGFDVSYSEESGVQGADYIIVNTCTVKKPTEQKIIHRLKTLSSFGSKLIVTGCLATANTNLVERTVPDASIVTTGNVHMIGEAIRKINENKQARFVGFSRVDKLSYPINNNSTIATIPISEGCLSNCTFCETKFARGPLNSFSEELILRAVRNALANGAKEIELTSQDTGAYGADKKTNIAELAASVASLEGDFRIRIGMLNPEHIHKYFDNLIEALSNKKVYKFLHLPVQSGSNKVLNEMNRKYTIEEFESYVAEVRKKLPEITIATDIIVGYPTESDKDFSETLEMLGRVKPYTTNLSKFGVRPHAPASKLKQLSNTVIKERSVAAARAIRSIQSDERAKDIGKRMRVLVTEKNLRSLTGRDNSYKEIAISQQANVPLGSFVDVDIKSSTSACLLGKLSGSDNEGKV